MLLSTFFFSLMHLSVKLLPGYSSYELVFFRSFVALVLSVSALQSKKIPIFGNNKKLLLLRGTAGVTALILFFTTLQRIPMGSAVTIQYISPIFTSIFALLFLREKMKTIQFAFFGIAFIGVLLINQLDTRVSLQDALIGLASALLAGIAYTAVRELRKTEHHMVVVFYFPLLATPVSAFLMLSDWKLPSGLEWFYLLIIGVFAQIAQIFMTKGFQMEKANSAAAMKYTGVLFAVSYGYFFFDETYSLKSFLGIILVLLGVVLNVIYKQKKR